MNAPDFLSLLIEAAARNHGLPTRLVAAVVRVESSSNPWAMRYEPAFYDRYVRGQQTRVFGAVSRDTERTARATSWGLMQVMGETARCLGCTLPFLSQLCDPAMGLEWGCKLLMRLSARYSDWPTVVAAYNAGTPRKDGAGRFVNQPYVDKIFNACGGAWPPKE